MAERPRLSADPRAAAARHPALFQRVTRARIATVLVIIAMLALFALGIVMLEFDARRFFQGLFRLGEFVVFMVPPSTGNWATFLIYLHALAETVAIALLGTLLAAVPAIVFGFLAAKNVVPQFLIHFLSRRVLDTVRGVDELIWALIWVNVVGLGPFAGILAVASANFGAFGKLFSEAIEAADPKPVEGVVSAGGGRLAAVRFGLWPQVAPVIASQVLYYFESNTRSATIIGIVGAGGIGLHLAEQIRTLEFQHVSALVLMILATVAVIDWLSTMLRFSIIGRRETVG
ncbi:phosphonate ABC transporter, permease protein PhnE [Blastochloris tepida]|uniref:Phosphonate ABC transporter, permease protein PhnE n=2 Tax=Blastochloris tepida TaxID=2233851 RepID=A0A348G0H1_9HYPH|nr:phosphonate ABC transporter, permease protein PhnE [Blastochloris tepida]BBF93054.1 phosphonate ABC transporter, permease protein PhnE [Blastochloris tepida]